MDYSSQITSEEILQNAFRPKDQRHVELPRKLRYPVSFEHYITWADRSGNCRYLVFKKPGTNSLVGMVFQRSRQSESVSATRLCDWCHVYGPGDQIDLLTVSPSSRKTVGQILCVDLSCIEKLEIVAKTSRKGFDDLAQELVARMARFYDEVFTDEGRQYLTKW